MKCLNKIIEDSDLNYNINKDKPIRIFLGGTCNDSTWRDYIIPKLDVDYFNPVVDDWTEEAYQEELKAINDCEIMLFVITPSMKGCYSIAEAIYYSHKEEKDCIFMFLPEYDDKEFKDFEIKSLDKVGVLVEKSGGYYFENKYGDLDDLVYYINQTYGGRK